MAKKFTTKQQRFIDFYDGNATAAALKAGYSQRTAYSIGQENLNKPEIADAIGKREVKRNGPIIMSREDRQVFWTKMTKQAERDGDKLKASELLGRSQADFTDRHEVDVSETVEEMLKKLTE